MLNGCGLFAFHCKTWIINFEIFKLKYSCINSLDGKMFSLELLNQVNFSCKFVHYKFVDLLPMWTL